MDDLIMKEIRKKVQALYYFEKMLELDDKHFKFVLLGNELIEVTDLLSGSVQYVNVACDNVPAMIHDILKQAGDWIL